MSIDSNLRLELERIEQALDVSEARSDGESGTSRVELLAAKALLLRRLGDHGGALQVWHGILAEVTPAVAAAQPAIGSRVRLQMVADLRALDRRDEAISVCDEVIEQRDGVSDSQEELAVARALFMKSEVLSDQGAPAQELEVLREIVDRYVAAPWRELRLRADRAISNSVVVLMQADRLAEGQAMLHQLLGALEDEPDDEVAAESAELILRLGRLYVTRGHGQDAVENLGLLAQQLESRPERGLMEIAVRARLERAYALTKLGRLKEARREFETTTMMGDAAVAVFEQLSQDLDTPSTSPVQERAVWAALARAIALGQLGRREDAHTAVTELISRFGDSDSSLIDQIVSLARAAQAELADARPAGSDQ
jgi:tetratricopeptide (TPR) repeat protein